MKNAFRFLIALKILLVSQLVFADDSFSSKIHPMLRTGEVGLEQGFLVYLEKQADISKAKDLKTKGEKGRFIYDSRRAIALAAQSKIIAELSSMNVQHHAYWIVNAIWVRGDKDLMERLAAKKEVAKIGIRKTFPKFVRQLTRKRFE